MYYVVNAAGQTEGPHPAEWVRANATSATLVSDGQRWVSYQTHPDFRSQGTAALSTVTTCPGCEVARSHGLHFCTTCGNPIAPSSVAPLQSPSPNLALLNILLPGVAQIVFGQVAKGLVMLVLTIVTSPTVFIPFTIMVLAVIDGFKVGGKLRRTGVVGPWEFFPS
jgi:hypothetical protein